MTFFAKHHYSTPGVFEKKINLYLVGIIFCLLFSSASYAQDINLRLKVTLSQLSSKIKMVQAVCDFSQGKDKAYGSDFIIPEKGGFDGYVNIPVTIHKPLSEYKNIGCEIRLCSSTNKLKACDRPIAASQLNTLIKPYNTYADNAFNRISAEQPLAESLVILHTPPPSYQMANKSNQNKKQKSSAASNASMTLEGAASNVNDGGAVVETIKAFAEVVRNRNFSTTTGFVVGLVGLAGSKLLGASDNAAAQILGDLVGLGFTFAGAALEGAAVAATASSATVLPLTAALTTGYGLGAKVDKFLGKNGKTASERIIQPLLPVDNGDTPEFLAAAENARIRREAEKNAQNEQQEQNNNANTNPGNTNNDTNTGDAQRGQPTTDANLGAGNNVQEQENQELNSTPAPETSPNTTSASNEEVEAKSPQKMGTGVIIDSRTNEDGSYSYTSMVYENTPDGGKHLIDVITTTCASGMCVSIGESGKQEVHPDNSGGAPQNDTVAAVSLGSEDSSSDSEDDGATSDDAGATNDGSGATNDGSGGDDEGDDSGGCSEEGGTCDKDDSEEPSGDEDESQKDAKESNNSTPNPNEQDSAGQGLAWAMQNPDNPLAQNILQNAANAVLKNSGYCQRGCTDDTKEGGLLWAMLNPGNPLAQSILATAAESIINNSGKGQTGGSEDNPAIDVEAGEDMIRLEFILSGSGVVDPVDGDGGNTPDAPPNAAPIIGGGAPVSIQENKMKIKADVYKNNGSSGNTGGSNQNEQQINIDQQNIKARIR